MREKPFKFKQNSQIHYKRTDITVAIFIKLGDDASLKYSGHVPDFHALNLAWQENNQWH